MSDHGVRVTLQFSAGCPNWQRAHGLVLEALEQCGLPRTVLLQPVSTPEEAEAAGFRGSPTVLVDGADPFADPVAPVGLTCRVFPTPQGLRGTPTLEQLCTALRAR